jgi:hypothetical protein
MDAEGGFACRQKMLEDKGSITKSIARQFRKARSQLEETLRSQEASVLEKYGKLSVRETALSRKYVVRSRHFPQPIEVRIHLLRAIKTKLPKGAYLCMLTQYESLGGRPLCWSKTGTSPVLNRREWGECRLINACRFIRDWR